MSLNKYITVVAAAKRIETYKAEIYTIDDFLSPEECRALRDCIDSHATRSVIYSGSGTERIESEMRTSWTAKLKPATDPLIPLIDKRIVETLGLRSECGEVMQGQRYDVGQEFVDHTDYFKRKWYHWLSKGQRTWTFMIYLNGDCQGGATEFSLLKLSFEPKEGMALYWNNLRPNGRPNPDTMHAGRPVHSGSKYIITKWFRNGPVPPTSSSKIQGL